MADYQYLPDMNDPVSKLRMAMNSMDGLEPYRFLADFFFLANTYPSLLVDTLRSYTIPHEPKGGESRSTSPIVVDETLTNLDPQLLSISQDQKQVGSSSKLRAFPPPLFSRQAIPQGYKSLNLSPFNILILTFFCFAAL